MIIDVHKLPREGLSVSKDFEFSSDVLVEESAVFFEPVRAELTIKKVGENILIKGKITTRLSFVCSRCLVPFEFPIDSSFDLVYFPEELDGIKDQLEDEDLDKLFYSEAKLDVEEVVLEQLNIAFPIRPLCSEDCQGICPVCGKIIKSGRCVCVMKDTDTRLEKLKIFIRDKR